MSVYTSYGTSNNLECKASNGLKLRSLDSCSCSVTTWVTSTLWPFFCVWIMGLPYPPFRFFPRLDLENVFKALGMWEELFQRVVGIIISAITLLLLLLKCTPSLRNSFACFCINYRKVLSTWAIKPLWSRHFWERSWDYCMGLYFTKDVKNVRGLWFSHSSPLWLYALILVFH